MIGKVVVNGEVFEVCEVDFQVLMWDLFNLFIGVILLIVVLVFSFMLYDMLV